MRYEHIDRVEVSAQFSSEGESRYRNRLEITLKDAAPTGKTVCVVMQNPSDAGEDVADKSVQFLEKVVFAKGLPEFVGMRRLIVVNQFAYIQTNDFEGLPHQIGELNNAAIMTALNESDIVVLAWGSSNRFEERKAYVFWSAWRHYAENSVEDQDASVTRTVRWIHSALRIRRFLVIPKQYFMA